MGHTTIVLLLAAATSAQGNVMPWQKGSALQSVVKRIADSKGRRLQAAMMSADCTTACPGVMDFITEVSQASGDEGTMAAMCSHLATLTCIATNTVCQDEGSKEITDAAPMMGCACACPAIMTADIEMEGGTLTAEECEIVKCVKGEAGCEPVMASADADAKKSMDSCDAPPTSDHAATQAVPFALLVLSVTSLFA
jgi:hypothetical protein